MTGMAAILSRRYWGTRCLLQNPSSAFAGHPRLASRGYAVAAVVTKNSKAAKTVVAKVASTTKPAKPVQKAVPTMKPAKPVQKAVPTTKPAKPVQKAVPTTKLATPAPKASTTKSTTPVPKVAATTKSAKPAPKAAPATKSEKPAPKVAPTTNSAKPAPKVAPTVKSAKPAPKVAPTVKSAKPAPKVAPTVKSAEPVPKAAPPTPPDVATEKPATQSSTTKTVAKSERPKLLKSGGRLNLRYLEQKKLEEMSPEEQLARLEQAIALSKLAPTRDIWGNEVETFDVMIPYSTRFSHRSDYSSWREMFEQFKENRNNALKNYMSMALLAWENGIPGLDLSGNRWWHKFLTRWPWRLATTTSIAEGSWLAPLRKAALDTYRQLNTAVAKGDDQTIKELTSNTYQDTVLRLRKKQKRDCKYIWHFHKEVTPARVLSIRAAQGYLAQDPPKFGNRNIVQALVRIDTEQSLEIYTNQGVPLHAQAATRVKGGSSAEPARVTEYFVFEKKMWYDGPWIIREQLWEVPGKKAAI